MVTDVGGSVTVQVASAVVVFGGLFVGMGWPLLGPLGRVARDAEGGQAAPAPSAATDMSTTRR
jgi:hypothetical protein